MQRIPFLGRKLPGVFWARIYNANEGCWGFSLLSQKFQLKIIQSHEQCPAAEKMFAHAFHHPSDPLCPFHVHTLSHSVLSHPCSWDGAWTLGPPGSVPSAMQFSPCHKMSVEWHPKMSKSSFVNTDFCLPPFSCFLFIYFSLLMLILLAFKKSDFC